MVRSAARTTSDDRGSLRSNDTNCSDELSLSSSSDPFPDISPRIAFQLGDADLSRLAHDAKQNAEQPENHMQGVGKHVRSLVSGGLNGAITTFSVVAGVAGADLPREVTLILGFACLIAMAISTGFSECLSSRAEREYAWFERERESWEMDNYAAGEKREMVEIYMQRGFSEADATAAIEILSKNKKWFVDHMMVQELGLLPPDLDHKLCDTTISSAGVAGWITSLSFLACGLAPLSPYLFASRSMAFSLSCVLTALTLAALSLSRAHLTGHMATFPKYYETNGRARQAVAVIRASLSYLPCALLAALSAYVVGQTVSSLLGFKCSS